MPVSSVDRGECGTKPRRGSPWRPVREIKGRLRLPGKTKNDLRRRRSLFYLIARLAETRRRGHASPPFCRGRGESRDRHGSVQAADP